MRYIYFRTLSETVKEMIVKATQGEEDKVAALKSTLETFENSNEEYAALKDLAEEVKDAINGVPDKELEKIIEELDEEMQDA